MTKESRPLVVRIAESRRQVQLLSSQLREKTGVTGSQAQILCALMEKDGVSQTALVSITNIDRSTLAECVRRLVNKGWIARRRTKEDARMYSVRLTSEGKRIAERVNKTV